MSMDAKEIRDKTAQDFKQMVFGHAIANQNRALFFEMFPEYIRKPEAQEGEWTVPRSEEELQKMLAEWNVGRIS
jgi:hypothetical protein